MAAGQPAGIAVLVCPPLAPDSAPAPWVEALVTQLQEHGVPTVVPATAPLDSRASAGAAGDVDDRLVLAGWVADQAVAVNASGVAGPLLLVAHGCAVRGLAALGLAQRASRHDVAGYLLVDGPIPPPGRHSQVWPDERVVYVHSPDGDPHGAATAHERGWEVHDGDPVDICLSQVLAWPAPSAGGGGTT